MSNQQDEAEMIPMNGSGNTPVESRKDCDDDKMTCGEFCSGCFSSMRARSCKDWATSFGKFTCLMAALYAFLFALDLMGGAFKVLGGCTAGGMFDSVTNPIAGLMIGVLATVLVQSSSTSTSITVSLVGAGQIPVRNAIPVIMGSNIGTSITNTIVSVGQIGDPDQFEKAFAGATVHDMFNFLTVAVLLPIELITRALERLSGALAPSEVAKGEKWTGPLKIIVSPLVKLFLNADKKVISNVALGKTTCEDIYKKISTLPEVMPSDCNEWETGLIKCSCDDDTGVGSCPAFFSYKASEKDDMVAGGVALFVSLVVLVIALLVMVKLLQSMVLGVSSRMLRKATEVHPIFAILIGIGVTIMVQSSSVTTSVLTPLVGVGVIPLERMLPLTIGANIGTTATAFLASLVSEKTESVQISLCHLFFNIFGTLIWYPLPFMRKIPLNAAKGLGSLTRRSKLTPLFYILFAFIALPFALLGISVLVEKGGAYSSLGIILAVFLIVFLGYTLLWWFKFNGKNKTYDWLSTKQIHREHVQNLPEIITNLQSQIAELQQHLGKDSNKVAHPMTDASAFV